MSIRTFTVMIDCDRPEVEDRIYLSRGIKNAIFADLGVNRKDADIEVIETTKRPTMMGRRNS